MFVVSQLPKSISAEAYRSLRTNIKYASIDKKIKTIVITSSIPEEGKSTVSGNLAITLSEAGSKVLLIDCDLRNPSLHRKFRVSNTFGLTDLLIEKNVVKECVKEITKNLGLITSGSLPPNPAEVIGSNAFEKFIKIMSETYDYIILDTPPLIPVTDGQILSAKADGTILVARSRKTKAKTLKQGYEKLKEVNSNVIGTVLNDSDYIKNHKYNYYYGTEDKLKWLKKLKGKRKWKT